MVAAQRLSILLVAGPNGSGKTTFAESYVLARRKKVAFINPDVIAAGLGPTDVEGVAFRAGRVMIARIRELIAARESRFRRSFPSPKGAAMKPRDLDATLPKDLREALRRFPEIVRQKRRRYRKRQRFLRDVFGPLMRELQAEERRAARLRRPKKPLGN